VPLFERLLPRHMQIVYAINANTLLLRVRSKEKKFSDGSADPLDLADRRGWRAPRAHGQSCLCRFAFSVNGVSALHTELMKETVFADLHQLYPDRINNKTNGITPRRWLMQCNPGLTGT
jgi:starch phosphorylase